MTILGLGCVCAAACLATPGDREGASWEGDRELATSTGGLDEATAGDEACGWLRTANLGLHTLNVRSGPSVSTTKVGNLYPTQVVAVLDETTGQKLYDSKLGVSSDGWFQIELGSKVGFVTALYAECTEAPEIPGWRWPVPGTASILQDFGNHIGYQGCGFHTGLDIGGKVGDPIVAAAPGEVVYVGPLWLAGTGVGRGPHAIVIAHGDGSTVTTYSHNDAALVEVGDVVEAGDLIAELGDLGYSFAPHLHFELLEDAPFTGDWEAPFGEACAHYVNPNAYVQP